MLWEGTWSGGLPEGACPKGHMGVEPAVSKLGSECWHSTGSCRCLGWWWGREMVPTRSLVPGGVSQSLPLQHALLRLVNKSSYVPQCPRGFQIAASMQSLQGCLECSPSGDSVFSCLPGSSRAEPTDSQSCTFRPCRLRTHKIRALWFSKPNILGICLPCVGSNA